MKSLGFCYHSGREQVTLSLESQSTDCFGLCTISEELTQCRLLSQFSFNFLLKGAYYRDTKRGNRTWDKKLALFTLCETCSVCVCVLVYVKVADSDRECSDSKCKSHAAFNYHCSELMGAIISPCKQV